MLLNLCLIHTDGIGEITTCLLALPPPYIVYIITCSIHAHTVIRHISSVAIASIAQGYVILNFPICSIALSRGTEVRAQFLGASVR